MTEATVTNLDDERLIRDGEAAVELWTKSTKDARDMVLPMARGLLAARRRYPANQEFGAWLQTSRYAEVGPTDRAALIHIGKHKVFVGTYLRKHRNTSPELIWEAIKELVPSSDDRKTPAVVTHIIEKPEIGIDLPEKPQSPVQDEAPKERISPVEVGPRHPLHKVRRVDEVFAIFSRANTRGTLNKLKGKRGFGQIWELILTALDAGMLQPTHTKIERPNLRFLFPLGSGRYCGRFDLTDTKTREHVRDVLLPLMIQNKDALFARPDEVEQILDGAQRKQVADQRAATVQQRAVKALAALPSDESEVIMFGKRLWPIVEGETIGAYDFRTLQVAVWKFTDLNRWLHRESPRSRAINIRNSTKWDRHFIGELLKDSGDLRFKIDRIYQLVHAITQLMEQNPDGECKEPLTPLVLG